MWRAKDIPDSCRFYAESLVTILRPEEAEKAMESDTGNVINFMSKKKNESAAGTASSPPSSPRNLSGGVRFGDGGPSSPKEKKKVPSNGGAKGAKGGGGGNVKPVEHLEMFVAALKNNKHISKMLEQRKVRRETSSPNEQTNVHKQAF